MSRMCGYRPVVRRRCVGLADRNWTRMANVLTGGMQPWTVSLSDVTHSARRLLGVSATSVMVVSASAARGLTAGTDDRVDALEQFCGLLGEGPAVDAVRDNHPVLVSDLAAQRDRWPRFSAMALDRDIAAIFAFPLRAGPLPLGTLTLYRERPGALSGAQRVLALRIADAIIEIVLAAQAQQPSHRGLAAPIAKLVVHEPVINQAVGMVAVQLHCDLVEAAVRLRAHAYAHDRPLDEIAQAVIEQRLQVER